MAVRLKAWPGKTAVCVGGKINDFSGAARWNAASKYMVVSWLHLCILSAPKTVLQGQQINGKPKAAVKWSRCHPFYLSLVTLQGYLSPAVLLFSPLYLILSLANRSNKTWKKTEDISVCRHWFSLWPESKPNPFLSFLVILLCLCVWGRVCECVCLSFYLNERPQRTCIGLIRLRARRGSVRAGWLRVHER